jgi:hypothetical protein
MPTRSEPDKDRPPRRNKRIDVPVDEELYNRAKRKAGSLSRLRAAVRAFLDLWSDNELRQGLPEEEIERQEVRAKKRKLKPKKGNQAAEDD